MWAIVNGEQLRVTYGGEVDEDRAVTELGSELLCGCERQACLAGAARAGQGHEPDVVAAEQRSHRGDFQPAPEQRRWRRRQLDARPVRELRGLEGRVMSQDPALEVLQLGARVDSELLHEDLSCAPIRLECVLLASGAVEREHVLGPKPLSVRLLDDQAFELRKQVVVTPERELGVVEPFLCIEPAIRETRRFCLGHAFTAQISERRPVPQLERRPQIVGGIGRWEPCCRAPPAARTGRRRARPGSA